MFEIKLAMTTLQDITAPYFRVVREHLPPLQLTQIQSLDIENIGLVLSTVSKKGSVIEKSYMVRAEATPGEVIIGADVQEGTAEILNWVHAKDTTMDIIGEPVSEKIVEEYFAEKLGACPGCMENDCVVIASLTIDSQGLITGLDDIAPRQHVYNNPLLYKLITCTEKRIGQLPPHALTHQYVGTDEINVANLLGVLAEPQKVSVQKEDDPEKVRTKLSFSGLGVSVRDDFYNNRINIEIPCSVCHRPG